MTVHSHLFQLLSLWAHSNLWWWLNLSLQGLQLWPGNTVKDEGKICHWNNHTWNWWFLRLFLRLINHMDTFSVSQIPKLENWKLGNTEHPGVAEVWLGSNPAENLPLTLPCLTIAMSGMECLTRAEADIMLLVDGSWSIGRANFRTVRNFISRIVEVFEIGPKRVQIGRSDDTEDI